MLPDNATRWPQFCLITNSQSLNARNIDMAWNYVLHLEDLIVDNQKSQNTIKEQKSIQQRPQSDLYQGRFANAACFADSVFCILLSEKDWFERRYKLTWKYSFSRRGAYFWEMCEFWIKLQKSFTLKKKLHKIYQIRLKINAYVRRFRIIVTALSRILISVRLRIPNFSFLMLELYWNSLKF